MSLSLLADPVANVRESLEAYRFRLNQANVPAHAIAAQRVVIVLPHEPFPRGQWLHVFTAVGTVIAEFGALDLEEIPASHARDLRLHAMAGFYLAHFETHSAIAIAAFDFLHRALVTRPQMHDAGSKQDRRDRATAAGNEAGKEHSKRGRKTDQMITMAWAKLAARGTPERGRSKVIASDFGIDQATVNKRVKVLNLRAK